MAEITLYSLSDYNNGDLIAHTFDLDDYSNHDEYLQAISEWLKEVDKEQGIDLYISQREEWIVCDYEDIPSKFVGEYDLDSEYWAFKEILDQTHVPAEAIEVWINRGYDLDQDAIEENYEGEHDNDEDFVQGLLENSGAIPSDFPAYIHIDWEITAWSVMQDYFTDDGHYFRIH